MELKEIDKKILYHIDFHAREPLSLLSKRIGISKQRLLFRMKKLEEEEIIQGYYADIDPSALGLVVYLVYFKFQHITDEKEKELVSHSNKAADAGLNVSSQGKWDHTIAIFANDLYEYRKIYNTLMKNYEKFVKDKQLTIITDFHYYPPKFFLHNKETHCIESHGPLKKRLLDQKDEIILKTLAKNARTSLVDLATATKLTAPGVSSRVKILEKKKIILGYRVMINYEKLGKLHYRLFLFLKHDMKKEETLKKFLGKQKEVISITKAEGYSDLDVRIMVDDLGNFYQFIKKIKKEFSGILKDYESLLYYKFYKSLNYYPVK